MKPHPRNRRIPDFSLVLLIKKINLLMCHSKCIKTFFHTFASVMIKSFFHDKDWLPVLVDGLFDRIFAIENHEKLYQAIEKPPRGTSRS